MPGKGMPGIAVPVFARYETKTVPIGYVPPDMHLEADAEGLPTIIEEVVGKKYAMFGEILAQFAAKGWFPWMVIPFPGVSTQFLVFIREPKE